VAVCYGPAELERNVIPGYWRSRELSEQGQGENIREQDDLVYNIVKGRLFYAFN
jgi:hypothetical protein